MRILILGGTGNISTSISQQLLQAGHELTLFKRSTSGSMSPPILEGVKIILGDRTISSDFESKMKAAGSFDCVIDMICYRPSEAESAIRAFRGQIGQFIFTSTVDVYTKSVGGYPLNEQAERNPSPEFSYAFEKAKCERIFEEAHEQGDLQVTTLRPAHTYTRFFIHTFGWETYFLDRLRKGKPVIVHGDGTSIWVATHSDDVARAYVRAIGNKRAFGRAYHLSGDEWMTWNKYHQILARAIGAPQPKLIHIPTDLLVRLAPKAAQWCAMNFSHNNIFDPTAAKKDLGFRYTIPWENGSRLGYEELNQRGLIQNSDDHPFYDRVIDAWQNLAARMVEITADLDL